ncbi:MAG: 30S ribosomal protein S12 methylthiotransferase RimO [Candidatus Aminicenantes bacterium]|nr:30S ribosomal protein S12 methylthiotransferase RimO [Candidatus Aminicenantes bacterium]MDH5384730.1 30S ribosomal protein S12 methylthiotransferase RimO [Candidatus Aminicenantes bacterium]
MKKVALVSLGCAKNLVDSEVMLGLLEEKQYECVTNLKEADIIIINTCGFIHPARHESLDSIKQALQEKKTSKEKNIIVAGCYVQRSRTMLQKLFQDVDGWIGVNDFDKIVYAVEKQPYENSQSCFLYDHTSPRKISTPPAWTYVKISEGCSHTCSFCSIPLIKGPYQSRGIASIIHEVKELVSSGIKEINLVSQDSTYFGRDQKDKDGLVHLLEELLNIKNLEWIRILYSYPEEITDSLLDIMKEKKICSYLDIPFQHSHPSIIKKMNRGLDGKRALKSLENIRKKIPDIAIRTSLVVGFPGEGKEEFEDLKTFVTQARFDHLGVFTYSLEDGTGCYGLGDPVKEREKTKRKEKIMDIQAEISHANNRKYLHQKIDVLIEGTLKQDSRLMVGRGQFQAPEVDGVILITARGRKPEIFNTLQKVEIADTDVYDLYGNLLR